jgi:hypothetical protein
MARLPIRPGRTRIVTGVFFNDPFFASLAPPPLAQMDPCFQAWLTANHLAQYLTICQGEGARTEACNQLQTRYIEAARTYADCLDRTYGLGLFKPVPHLGR